MDKRYALYLALIVPFLITGLYAKQPDAAKSSDSKFNQAEIIPDEPASGANLGKVIKPSTIDLSKVPQINETKEQRDARMEWFRDAKFGMFIHWGPCSVGQAEIGWGRKASRPWDIRTTGAEPRTSDPVYDNYYKQFNPTNYNADAWVKFAKASGMKYMVLIAKHHDGFAQFDSKLSEHTIMHSPYGKDIVKQFLDACHANGMRAGIYYSTRDWFHPDYLMGDNVKYDTWYRGQVQELLGNYGTVDEMWFDHVGGRDWGKWKFGKLFAMMYRLQPKLIVNNRAAKFCGPPSPEDRKPTHEIMKMTQGDFDTPEGRIGKMDIANDWESCIHVGKGWSYRGEDGFKGSEDCIKMLVSCTTGGGNLLLNFGPRPDGTFADGEVKVACAMGEWLKKYGDAIYGTRGGPYQNGIWGGSCHKDNKLFLHILYWQNESLSFDPLPYEVKSARTLTGAPVQFTQNANEFTIKVAKADQDKPVTVIELTLNQPVENGKIIGKAHMPPSSDVNGYGTRLGQNATLELSSVSANDKAENHERLLKGEKLRGEFAFQTKNEQNPWAKVDLGKIENVHAVVFDSLPSDKNFANIILSTSVDGTTWEKAAKSGSKEAQLRPHGTVVLSQLETGTIVPGKQVRYLKFEIKSKTPVPLSLQRVEMYGDE